MMPLSASARSPSRGLIAGGHTASLQDDDDAYGTFQSRVNSIATAERSRSSSKLWRVVGIVALLAVGASVALLQKSPQLEAEAVAVAATQEIVDLHHSHHPKADELSKLEKRFLDHVDTNEIRKYHTAYASVPHPAGSKQDYETALYTAEMFESFGIHAEIKEYYPLLSWPVHRHLSIVSPPEAARELNLTEGSIPGDACTSDVTALPPFLGYAASGNVTASVVYVHFATPDDFALLKAQNVTLESKIALVRYGGNFRGLKVMLSEQHGMAGVLIYSDPMEDGFAQGPVYPEGPWRPEDSFQRGSVQYNSLSGGDPLTPGFPSLPGEPYLSIEECPSIPHIPTLPLSYGQAQHILRSMGGSKAPEAWQGALDMGYFLGDDENTVLNLDLLMDNKVGPIWDVIGTIPGEEEPEQLVMIGNHRDAWVCGAVDPSSASAAMMEIARGLSELLKNGWKPRRTLVISSWDGEEMGLLGSTEYAEDHAESLSERAVAYINVDNVVGGMVEAQGTPSIAKFMQDTAKLIPGNPFEGPDVAIPDSLHQQWVMQAGARRAKLAAGVDDGTLAPDHLIKFLGSGTDYTAYYQHLGIISANLGFTVNGGTYGTYHSSMDSLPYMRTVGDPHYATHTTMVKWWGLVALRLADNAIVPFDYSTYGLVMQEDLAAYEETTKAMDRDVDYSALHAAIADFTVNAELFQARVTAFSLRSAAAGDEGVAATAECKYWNEKLVRVERYLLSDAGLPHRTWFKHLIFGPGFYEGYAGAAFPGISDAIVFEDDASTMQVHVDDVAAVVHTAAEFLVAA